MRLVGVVVLLALGVRAWAAPATLDRIEVEADRGAVTLHLSKPVTARASALGPSGEAPDRIYIDLPNATLGHGAPTVVPGAGNVLRVRTGQFDSDTTRVVLDLRHAEPFALDAKGTTITIQVGSAHLAPPRTFAREREEPPPAVAGVPPTTPAEPPPSVATAPPAAAPPQEIAKLPVMPGPPPNTVTAQPPGVAPSPPSFSTAPPTSVVTAPSPTRPAAPPAVVVTPPAVVNPPPVIATPAPLVEEPRAEEPPAAVVEAPPAMTPPPATDAPPATTQTPPPAAETPPTVVARAPSAVIPPPPIATPPPPAVVHPPPVDEDPHPSAAPALPPPVVAVAPPPGTAPAAPQLEGPPEPPAGETQVAAAPPRKRSRLPRVPIFPLPVIVLDAGHGGRDPGAEGVGGVQEKDIVLRVTQRLAARLPTRIPAIVVLTRADDSFVSIDRRVAVPNDQAAAFVSVHANASNDPTLHGVEIFYGGGSVRTADAEGVSPQAVSLGRYLGDALRPHVDLLRRPRPGDFGVLVRNRVPSVLVEIGYLTHPHEGIRAQDPAYHDLVADALADGIAAFLYASAEHL